MSWDKVLVQMNAPVRFFRFCQYINAPNIKVHAVAILWVGAYSLQQCNVMILLGLELIHVDLNSCHDGLFAGLKAHQLRAATNHPSKAKNNNGNCSNRREKFQPQKYRNITLLKAVRSNPKNRNSMYLNIWYKPTFNLSQMSSSVRIKKIWF
jgi:hypothetical protein